MTPDEVRDAYVAYAEEHDRGQGVPIVHWTYWVAEVLLPMECEKAAKRIQQGPAKP